MFLTFVSGAAKTAAEKAASAVGGKIGGWLETKLSGQAEREVLDKAKASPASQGARRQLEGALLARLENDENLVQELARLLDDAKRETGLTIQQMKVVGSHNKTAQISGNGNIVKF